MKNLPGDIKTLSNNLGNKKFFSGEKVNKFCSYFLAK